jgi:retron-type reverse transcriptase
VSVKQLETYLNNNRERLVDEVYSGNYHAPAIRRKKIPKSNGKKRLLDIPTVINRILQQAVARKLMNHYEFMFYSQ